MDSIFKFIIEFNFQVLRFDLIGKNKIFPKIFFSLHDFIEELASEFGFKEMPFQLKANLGSYGDLINRRGTIDLAIYDTKNPEALHIAHENGKVFLNLIKP